MNQVNDLKWPLVYWDWDKQYMSFMSWVLGIEALDAFFYVLLIAFGKRSGTAIVLHCFILADVTSGIGAFNADKLSHRSGHYK